MSEKAMLENYQIRVYEDLSAYKARIKVIRTKMITDQTINIVINVPYFESNSLKHRSFEVCFEKIGSNDNQLEVNRENIYAVIRVAGQDFLILEQMQQEV